ncbi:MAG TPA: AAA family ATPase [Candidatus Angelobacter sp.]|jgi:DNA repair exonuclease SbcCD ATPase subunit|nr:AAA family ATPase [Candidatus Angelobacter sp.]
MKINRLSLTNFRSHRATEFDLDRVTIFRGVNGAGKSSIQDALEFLFTGTTRQTDAGGRGADLLVSHGTGMRNPEMAVQARLADDLASICIQRIGGTNQFEINWKEGDHWTRYLGDRGRACVAEHIAPLPVLQAVLNSGRFLSLSEKEQKNLLTSALASKPVVVPDEIVKPMRKLLELEARSRLCLEVPDAATADSIHKIYYDLRTDLNRQIKALGELTATEVPADAPDPALVKKQLADLNKERDGLLQSREKRQASHAADRIRLSEAQRQLDAFKDAILEDGEVDKLQKTAGRKLKAAEIQTEIDNLTRRITADRDLVKQMKDAPDSCHACGRALVKDDITAKVDELELAIKTAEGLREEAQARLTKLGDPATADQKIAAHKKAVVATGSAERALKELKDLPETCDVSDLTQKLAALDLRIADGGEVLAEVQRLAGAKQQYDQTVAKKQELANRVLAAEKIINAFGPGGPIRAQLVGARIHDFHRKLNDSLERLGFNCDFTLEPYHVELTEVRDGKINSSQILSPRQLSESESFRFSIAFQIALAEATGVNFIVIDRSDVLLPELRSTLAETLLESKLDQAIVLVAGDHAPVALPPDVKLYDLAKDSQGHTGVAAEYKYYVNETVCEEMPQ